MAGGRFPRTEGHRGWYDRRGLRQLLCQGRGVGHRKRHHHRHGGGDSSPDATCTRAQAVTFLARAQNAKATGKTAFSDVPADSYFADAVAWAQANGVTTGTSETTFSPDSDCTRAQIVTFLYRANQGT
ncbi:MAG: S-layer homology domain-containing protein [Evtepia sp.]